jgi:GH25 family lysozyme M1 (1,4-beta-N-acetylmuramidase)
MGRISQFYGYINAKKTPTAQDIEFNYKHLTITDELRKVRYYHRLAVNEQEKKK